MVGVAADEGPVLRVAGYIRKSRVTMRDVRVRERAKARGISMPLASLAIQTEDIEFQVASERDGRKRRIVGFFQDIVSGRREDRTGRNELYQLAEAGVRPVVAGGRDGRHRLCE